MGLHDPDNRVGEEWLSGHDPEHDPEDSQREIPWGTAQDIAHLLDRSLDPHRIHGPRGRLIVSAETRDCLRCEETYTPRTRWQKYCSGACRQFAFKASRRGNAS